MFVRTDIVLDGSVSEREVPLAARGGIFFDTVPAPGALAIRFDEEQTLLPLQAGRVFHRAFKRLYLVAPAGITGTVTAYLFDKGEAIEHHFTTPVQSWHRTELVFQRSNNVVAYATMQVLGPAADARLLFANANPFPGEPVHFTIRAIRNNVAAPTLTVLVFPFDEPPNVLADQAAADFSDAAIASHERTAFSSVLSQLAFSVGLNTLLAAAGRSMAGTNLSTGHIFRGKDIWLYLRTTDAYTPLALEQFMIALYVRRMA